MKTTFEILNICWATNDLCSFASFVSGGTLQSTHGGDAWGHRS